MVSPLPLPLPLPTTQLRHRHTDDNLHSNHHYRTLDRNRSSGGSEDLEAVPSGTAAGVAAVVTSTTTTATKATTATTATTTPFAKSIFLDDDERKEHVQHGVYNGKTRVLSRAAWWWHLRQQRIKQPRKGSSSTFPKRGGHDCCTVLGVIGCVIFWMVFVLVLLRTRDGSSSILWAGWRLLFTPLASTYSTIAILPPNGSHVSVVIMNHNRPRMLKESGLIPTLVQHSHVGEILLCHSNAKTQFVHSHPKVRNLNAIEANERYGLSLRFHFAASHARYSWILMIDDDQEVSSEAISALMAEFSKNTKRIVGRYGRAFSLFWNPFRHGYNTRTVLGKVEVVLTKFMILERQLCQYFVEYAHVIPSTMLAQSKPLWNGEDIFMSLVANHVYGVPTAGPFENFAFYIQGVWEASDALKDDDTGQHDVSGNMDRHRLWNVGWNDYWKARQKAQEHTAYRGRLWELAKRELAKLPRPAQNTSTSTSTSTTMNKLGAWTKGKDDLVELDFPPQENDEENERMEISAE